MQRLKSKTKKSDNFNKKVKWKKNILVGLKKWFEIKIIINFILSIRKIFDSFN